MRHPAVLWLARHFAWIIALLILSGLVLSVPAFRRPAYWLHLTRQHFAVAALALALTPIILTGGIDLSVGSTTALVSVVIGALWSGLGWPLGLAFAAGMLTGLFAGLANGTLVAAGVPALVATLATRELYRGLAETTAGGERVLFPSTLTGLWRTPILGLPMSLYALIFLFVLTYLIVHKTWLGRMLYAIGDNEEAARFAAVPVRGLKLGLHAGSGLVAGLCGLAWVLQFGAAEPTGGGTLELAAIAAVVLGGVRITGGAGHVAGTVLGVVTLLALLAGMQQVRAEAGWRDSATGALLLLVALGNEAASRWATTAPDRSASDG
jgi:ribose/xylose/arabinose/galactoside ABC-type transport system permease subunit